MSLNKLVIYLSGEIHSAWRENIKEFCSNKKFEVKFLEPVTNHQNSDDCGKEILGSENSKFWEDYKGASINSIRIKNMIEKSNIVIVKFGDKYRQWNAAFDAGFAYKLGKPIITLHDSSLDHALKEIDAVANAVCRTEEQVVKTIEYVLQGTL